VIYKLKHISLNVSEEIKHILPDTLEKDLKDNEEPIKENYNKERRVHRGLFVSKSGKKINADVNGAYQIMKKVVPNVFSEGIEGAGLHPVRFNIS